MNKFLALVSKTKSQSVVGHSFIYLATNLLNSLIPFLLLPSYTRNLAPNELGILNLFDSTIIFSVPIIMFGFSGVVSVEYFKARRAFRFKFSSGILVPCLAYLLVLSIALIVVNTGVVTVSGEVSTRVVSVVLTIAILQVITQVRLALYQASRRPKHYFLLQSWIIVSSVVLTLYFVVNKDMSWQGRITALAIVYFVSGLLSVKTFISDGYLDLRSIAWRKFVEVFRLGAPLVPHALGMLVVLFVDRYLIAYYWGAEELGHYAVGFQIGMGISLIQNSFNQAWIPFLFSKLADKQSDHAVLISRVSYAFMALLFACALMLVGAAPSIFETFISDRYVRGIAYVPFIAFGFVFTGMYKIAVGYIFYARKNQWLAKIAVFNVFVSVVLNIFLIPLFGALGAAISFLISMMAVYLVTLLVSNKVRPKGWLRLKNCW